jgi:hypothetical protein
MRKILLFFLLAAVLASLLHVGISAGLRVVKKGEVSALNRALQGKVNADIVITGSSRAYRHYDPKILSATVGLEGFNMARNGSHTDVQLAVLRAYLKANKKPKIWIHNLDMHTFVPTKTGEIFEPSLYVPYLNVPELYEPFCKIDGHVWKWKWLPLYGYVVPEANLTWLTEFARLRSAPENPPFNGFRPMNKSWTKDFEKFKEKNPKGVGFAIDEALKAELEKTIHELKKDGVQVFLVYSPQYVDMLDLVTNKTEVFAAFREMAARQNVPFWDFSVSEISRTRDYFYNSQHLNAQGAAVFSEEVASRLRKFANTNSGAEKDPNRG